MKIVFSKHCMQEMIIRSIKKEDIINSIKNPDEIKQKETIRIVWKRFENDGLKVICREYADYVFVITAYPKHSI
ncbi:MAG: DUF4258 domain-containing protein [Candidatus Thermoplasmatota archaeon]|nr:DUF4258 domain-containing protein [Candidatus Thermoplasmatota archaeon]MBU4123956.1 DUF4258 domain-containing protein [Nanoarchaeota archaeon]